MTRERVIDGLRRAKALGTRIGRPRTQVGRDQILALRAAGLSHRVIGRRLRISPALAHRLARQTPVDAG